MSDFTRASKVADDEMNILWVTIYFLPCTRSKFTPAVARAKVAIDAFTFSGTPFRLLKTNHIESR